MTDRNFNSFRKQFAIALLEMSEQDYLSRTRELLERYERSDRTRHNPNVTGPKAVTRAGIHEGAKLLVVGFGVHPSAAEFEVKSVYTTERTGEFIRTSETHDRGRSLGDMGVIPRDNDGWSTNYATFVNDPETRRAVVEWLLSLGRSAATESAGRIVSSHPEDFPTRAVVRCGRLVAELRL